MVDLDIANSGGNTVTQVDASKGTVLGVIPVYNK